MRYSRIAWPCHWPSGRSTRHFGSCPRRGMGRHGEGWPGAAHLEHRVDVHRHLRGAALQAGGLRRREQRRLALEGVRQAECVQCAGQHRCERWATRRAVRPRRKKSPR